MNKLSESPDESNCLEILLKESTKLIQCRNDVAKVLEVDDNCLELSMGMSNDFVEAIAMGSTNVRVGSSIFGARNYPNKPSTNEAKKLPENDHF